MAIEDTVKQADTETAQTPPAATTAQTDQTASTTDLVDPDETELAEAKAALEKPAATTTTPNPKDTTQTPAAPAAKTEGAPATATTEGPMIPKGRLDQELAKSSAKDQVIAAQRGEIEALKLAKPVTTAPAATQTPPAADRLKDARVELRGLAKKFDDGEISMSEYEVQRQALDDKIYDIREEQTLARVKDAIPPAAPVQDLLLDERTTDLEAQHPYTSEITSQEDWEFLKRKAFESLAAEGKPLPAGELNARDKLTFRTRIAELTDAYGPQLTGKTLTLPKKASATPSTASTTPAAVPTPQQRDAKLAAAAAHPADISRVGGAGTGDEQFTDARIESMTDEEITALPASVRRRLLPTE